jgi:acyl-CoA synthetase (AMP-forming)/AMP-acid ligase II
MRADKILEMIHRIKNTEATVILAHPAMVNTALAAASKAGVRSFRIFQFSDCFCPPLNGVQDVLCGSAPLSKELQNQYMARFGLNIVQGWGMTEMTCGAVQVLGGRRDDTGSVSELDPN